MKIRSIRSIQIAENRCGQFGRAAHICFPGGLSNSYFKRLLEGNIRKIGGYKVKCVFFTKIVHIVTKIVRSIDKIAFLTLY